MITLIFEKPVFAQTPVLRNIYFQKTYLNIPYKPVFCTEYLRIFVKTFKAMKTTIKEHARFDARLPKEQKQFFERAAYLGGFRNLTDFVILTVQEKAKEIIKEKEQIIASEKDSQIFFDAITKPGKPSETLKKALDDYNAFISDSK